jgi:ZIP family zinc transporter
MWEAALWGFVGGFALLVGAVIGLRVRLPQPVVGGIMAFGAGVLISAVAFDLVEEGFDAAGTGPVLAGLTGGALVFFVGDAIIDRRGGNNRKRSGGQQAAGAPAAIVLGAVLDGIPESAAIGVSLLGGGTVSVAVVVAVFLSNVPESLSAAVGLRAAGKAPRRILAMWAVVAVVSALAAALGYVLLGDASTAVVAVVQAFAAGAILTMLADTMMPEAFQADGRLTGVLTTAGFVTAFVVSHL